MSEDAETAARLLDEAVARAKAKAAALGTTGEAKQVRYLPDGRVEVIDQSGRRRTFGPAETISVVADAPLERVAEHGDE